MTLSIPPRFPSPTRLASASGQATLAWLGRAPGNMHAGLFVSPTNCKSFVLSGWSRSRTCHGRGHPELAADQVGRPGLLAWSAGSRPGRTRRRPPSRRPAPPAPCPGRPGWARVRRGPGTPGRPGRAGPPRDVIAQQLAGRDVRDAEVRDQRALSPLARARGRDHQYPHHSSPGGHHPARLPWPVPGPLDPKGRVARPFGPFGGGGDVPEHAAEHDAVKRRNGSPEGMTCAPRGRKIARWL